MKRPLLAALAAVAYSALVPHSAYAVDVSIPVLVPITGFLSIEGSSQRNGALLAMRRAPKGITVKGEVSDTGVAPDVAANALERALAREKPTAVVASIFGVQVLAMLPIALEAKMPLITVSGTARITELNNPYVFRFFPGDHVTKDAHVRYVVQELKKQRIALVYQTTAYGQSGRTEIVANLKKFGIEPVLLEALEPNVRDMSSTISKIRAANADAVMVHVTSQPTALFIRAAAQAKLDLPIVASSTIHQPSTAALLEPAELANVCGETNGSPMSAESPEIAAFAKMYRDEFSAEPDGYALGQYDGVMMVLDAVSKGAKTPADVQKALATTSYKGLGMTYKSDGKGNMAHSAVIICYDGKTRVPKVVKRYDNITGALSK
jgi:branched-chain amino acid transport system substrate-binding protein